MELSHPAVNKGHDPAPDANGQDRLEREAAPSQGACGQTAQIRLGAMNALATAPYLLLYLLHLHWVGNDVASRRQLLQPGQRTGTLLGKVLAECAKAARPHRGREGVSKLHP